VAASLTPTTCDSNFAVGLGTMQCYKFIINIAWPDNQLRGNATLRDVAPPNVSLQTQSISFNFADGTSEVRFGTTTLLN